MIFIPWRSGSHRLYQKVLIVLSIFSTCCLGLIIPHETDLSVDRLSFKELEHLSNDPVVTHTVEFKLAKQVKGELYVYGNSIEIGSLKVGLFGTVVPITAENFLQLSNMTFGYGYEKSIFHRIIENFVIQGGDFERQDGTGGHSVFNDGKFLDENFNIKHSKKGRLSMANAGPNTNGAQFFITTTEDAGFLDGKHVVFGQLIDGFDTLSLLNKVSTDSNDRPHDDIYISDIKITDFGIKEELLKLGALDSRYSDASQMNRPLENGDKTINLEDIPVVPLDDSSMLSKYKYLFFFCICAIGYLTKKHYYRRQLVTDIKDNDYY